MGVKAWGIRKKGGEEDIGKRGDRRGEYMTLVGKPGGKKPLGGPRCKMVIKWIFKK
jgi:hypothetical protein